jgi:hypothetical protein
MAVATQYRLFSGSWGPDRRRLGPTKLSFYALISQPLIWNRRRGRGPMLIHTGPQSQNVTLRRLPRLRLLDVRQVQVSGLGWTREKCEAIAAGARRRLVGAQPSVKYLTQNGISSSSGPSLPCSSSRSSGVSSASCSAVANIRFCRPPSWGVLFEMQKQRGSHWTRCWREVDSNYRFRVARRREIAFDPTRLLRPVGNELRRLAPGRSRVSP